jgi:hypothetical protein
VRLRETLEKTRLRVTHGFALTFTRLVGGEDDKSEPIDPADEGANIAMNSPPGFGDGGAPTNWVPSQQDDRPRH